MKSFFSCCFLLLLSITQLLLRMTPDYFLTMILCFIRLRGVEGVRVVDASIMPQVVTANVMSTIIAIAEKAADMIKEEYSLWLIWLLVWFFSLLFIWLLVFLFVIDMTSCISLCDWYDFLYFSLWLIWLLVFLIVIDMTSCISLCDLYNFLYFSLWFIWLLVFLFVIYMTSCITLCDLYDFLYFSLWLLWLLPFMMFLWH